MIILIINILKKLPAVCWRIFNGDKWRISVQSEERYGLMSLLICTLSGKSRRPLHAQPPE